MQFYAIINNEIAIGSKDNLEKYYTNVQPLPADYNEHKYIVVDGVLKIDTETEKQEKLEALDNKYNADKTELMSAYLNALVYGNTDLADEIKSEIEALDEQYDADYEEIVGE